MDNNQLDVKVTISPDTSSVKQTSEAINKELSSQFKNYTEEIKKQLIELEKFKVDLSKDGQAQMLLRTSAISEENAKNTANYLKETYTEVFKEIEKKNQDIWSYDQHSELKKAIEQRKNDIERSDDQIAKDAFKRRQDVYGQEAGERRYQWTIKRKEIEDQAKDTEAIRKKMALFRSIGGGIGGAIGGSVGGGVGGGIGGAVGSAMAGGEFLAGGAIGAAIFALTAEIKHLSEVIDRNAETAYNAETLGTTANKLNAFKTAAGALGINENVATNAIAHIAEMQAALNIGPNGSYSGSTEESQKFAQTLSILKVRPVDENGIKRDPIDVFNELVRTDKRFAELGRNPQNKNYLLSQITNVPYLNMDRFASDKFLEEQAWAMTNVPLKDNVAELSQLGSIKKYQTKKNTDYIFGNKTLDLGDEFVAGVKKNFNNPDVTGYSGPGYHEYGSALDALLSDPVKHKQMMMESGGKAGIDKLIYNRHTRQYDHAVGLYQILLSVANSPEMQEHFKKGFSIEDLKNPKTNEKLHDYLVESNLKALLKVDPSLANNQQELAMQELALYNGGWDNVNRYKESGTMADSYGQQILNNISITINAQGNPNAQDIADKTQEQVKKVVNKGVMNSQPQVLV